MSKKVLYAEVSNIDIDDILSININYNHNAASSIATITAKSSALSLGDSITISLGYVNDYGQVFTGFVKQIEYKVPEKVYTIVANDKLIRAVDYFVVSDNPETPFKRKNITAENLVRDILNLAGITSFLYQATNFTLGINTDVEVNLVSAYDYCKSIADIVTWSLWADEYGGVHFKNRKPYVMTGNSGQPGDTTDERILYGESGSVSIGVISDYNPKQALMWSLTKSEADIRNRVVVYGENGSSASASSSTTYDPILNQNVTVFPNGFYKAAVIASPNLGKQFLNSIANYNLNLYNRVGYVLGVTAEGNYQYTARKIVTIKSALLSLEKNFYIYSSTLNWSRSGFTCDMVLRI